MSSTSTITGTAPIAKIDSTVATKVCAWVITSSPCFIPMATIATNCATVPEVTACVCLQENLSENAFSNSLTLNLPFLNASNP